MRVWMTSRTPTALLDFVDIMHRYTVELICFLHPDVARAIMCLSIEYRHETVRGLSADVA